MAATAIATRATRLVLIPPSVFEQWLALPAFRNFVMGMFADRMADLASLIDAIAFRRLDQRLAAALLGRGPDLSVTHQALADELGTCARSSPGCCAASSATAGSNWAVSASASSTVPPCDPWELP